MLYFLALPFGGALAARLRHHLWPIWTVWGGCSLIALIVLWIGGDFGSALLWTIGASALGFLGPELWTSCRSFVSHPRVFGWIVGIAAMIFLAFHQGLTGGLIMVGLIVLAFRVMLQPILRRGNRGGQPRDARRHH